MAKDATYHQMQTLEFIQTNPYLRGFEPRAYPSYEDRRVTPKIYLEEIGMEKIAEFVESGLTLVRIAQLIGVSTKILDRWIYNNPDYTREMRRALSFSAEEDIQLAEDKILEPKSNAIEMTQAIEYAKHKRWKAERNDRDRYGTQHVNVKGSLDNGVVFNFNMPASEKQLAIDSTSKLIEKLPDNTINMQSLFANSEELSP